MTQKGLFDDTPFEEPRAYFGGANQEYRYALNRVWDPWPDDPELKLPRILFIMLNPSTADADQDDPTIRRCIDFAKRWGFGRLDVANLFAYRATQPEEMKAHPEPIGPLNDRWIEDLAMDAHKIICAWGNHGRYRDRGAYVRSMLSSYALWAFKISKQGEPEHPLYQPRNIQLVRLH